MIITEKRVVAVFTAFALVMGCIGLRMYVVCSKGTSYVSSESHYYSIQLCDIRGRIEDCNSNDLVCNDYSNIVVAKPTIRALEAIEPALDDEMYTYIKERMEKSNAISVNIGGQEIKQNPDALVIKVYNRYSDNQLARHIIGYINSEGNGVTGIEKCYESILYTGQSMSARFAADAYGRIINGSQIVIQNSKLKTGTVKLTIDSMIQSAVENALEVGRVEQGGAIVIDVASGALRAMASRPLFDANNISEYMQSENSPLVNRTLQSYAVGSIFKVAVAAAALESGISDFKYECSGSCDVDGTVFHCNKSKVHGSLDMQKALECSCNVYFIKLAQKVGAKKILETIDQFGFGQQSEIGDGLISSSGVVPTIKSLASSGALANFSFGQGNFTASMVQIGKMMTAVANGGKYTEPYLVEKVTSADGSVVSEHDAPYPVVALSKDTSERLTKMLTSVVENGNAANAKLDGGIKAAGKTATAQTGTFNSAGVEICNTWFGGFFPVDNPKYVVIILKQGGNSGAEDCAPVFKLIADKINSLDR